jgi:hypothetical protein
MHLTHLELADIKARAAGATEGPWIHRVSGFIATAADPRRIVAVTCKEALDAVDPLPFARNAEFLAAARDDVPQLVAEVERLRYALGKLASGDVASPQDYARAVLSEAANRLNPPVSRV